MLAKLKISRNQAIFLFLILPLFALGLFLFGYDQALAQVDTGLDAVAATGLEKGPSLMLMIARVIRILLGFLGILMVVLIMYAGWLWMISEGDPEKVNKSKKIIINAIIGFLIIISSFALVQYIINSLQGETTFGPSAATSKSPGYVSGTGAIGNCSVLSTYPAPGEQDVVRNTSIIVTFKEEADVASFTVLGANGHLLIKEDVVGVFKKADVDSCINAATQAIMGTCPSKVADIEVYTNDNKTFLLVPLTYLGSPTTFTDYAVRFTQAVKKKNPSTEGMFDKCSPSFLHWEFKVGSTLDFDSPQVQARFGVTPYPDNGRDSSQSSPGQQATGKITLLAQPQTEVAASVSEIDIASRIGPEPQTSGSYGCDFDGTLKVVADGSGNVNVTPPANGFVSGDSIGDRIINIGCGIKFEPKDPAANFASGNTWTFKFVAKKSADNIRFDSHLFIFGQDIPLGATANATANNIRTKLLDAALIHDDSSVTGNVLNMVFPVPGVVGNNIMIETSDAGKISLSQFSGGTDFGETVTINGVKDEPRNSIIQINFNDAMNPITISGTADQVKDYIRVVNASATAKAAGVSCANDAECISFACNNSVCASGDYLDGKWQISNQYRTVEFISNEECGMNGCGEKVYCLPENADLRVELQAANIFSCTSSNDCVPKTPFSQCIAGVCHDAATGKNFPGVTLGSFSGAMDKALNSLDGNRNENAQGPLSYFSENSRNNNLGNQSFGDNFSWYFFINNRIEITPPALKAISPYDSSFNATNTNLNAEISGLFNKQMMSSSMGTGEYVAFNGKDSVTHKLVNLWSIGADPVGYWTTKEDYDPNNDGKPDETKVLIEHALFVDSTKYQSQMGSGLKDIYQNCYKPSQGPGCTDPADTSCCNGAGVSADSCGN